MSKDYSKHKLTNEDGLKVYYTRQFLKQSSYVSFWSYTEGIYNIITSMVEGESFDVDNIVSEENRDAFIKILCAFMLSGVAQGFYFNSTYTQFRRMPAPITQTKENILKPTLA